MKKVIITMDENGQFSVNGNVGSVELLGFIEFAKATVLKDIMNPGKIKESKNGLEGSKPPATEEQIRQSQIATSEK